jgi:ABC-type multidrug transport system fused ATPase/permease subunit
MVGVLFCIGLSNVIGVLIPFQFGAMTEALLDSGKGHNLWIAIALYLFLWILNTSWVILGVQKWLWQPIPQYSMRKLYNTTFGHVMGLSPAYHDNKSSPGLLINLKNSRSIIDLGDQLLINLITEIGQLFVSLVYLNYLFGPYMAVTCAFVMVGYSFLTVKIVAKVDKHRQNYLDTSRAEGEAAAVAVSGWQNVVVSIISCLFDLLPPLYKKPCFVHFMPLLQDEANYHLVFQSASI